MRVSVRRYVAVISVATLTWLALQPTESTGYAASASPGNGNPPNIGGMPPGSGASPTPTPDPPNDTPAPPPSATAAPTFAVPTQTSTPLPPTTTFTSTPVPPTATRTSTPLPPTATRTSTPLPPTPTPPAFWRPALNTTWQIQFTGALDTTAAVDLFEFDAFDATPAIIAAVRAKGAHAVCYVNAGAWEDWRPDAGVFPASVLGNDYGGWPGERWIDIRQIEILRPIIGARLDMCRAKGFEGAEFDNMDSYTHNTGFPLTATQQLTFNIFLSQLAHERGLGAGMKNDLEQIPSLVQHFDWVVNEECFEWGECSRLLPFVNAGKAALVIEYNTPLAEFCPVAASLNLSAILKRLSLDAWRQGCP